MKYIAETRSPQVLLHAAQRNLFSWVGSWCDCRLQLPATLRGSQDPSVLAKLQHHRFRSESEQEHRQKICGGIGRKVSHHHRANNGHPKKRTKAKRKSALYHPSHQRSSGSVPSATDAENGRRYSAATIGEVTEWDKQISLVQLPVMIEMYLLQKDVGCGGREHKKHRHKPTIFDLSFPARVDCPALCRAG